MRVVKTQLLDLAPFFDYLDKQLRDNAAPKTPIFQPLSSQQSQVSNQLRNKFKTGLTSSFGTSSWRQLWLVKSTGQNSLDEICGHIDLRHHDDEYRFHRVLLGMGVDEDYRRQG